MGDMTMGSIGDNVVDRYLAERMMYPGGGAANVSVHARRFGWEAHYVGVLGSDATGDLIVNALGREGVCLDGIQRVDEANASTDITLDARGNRQFSAWTPPRTEIVMTPEAHRSLRTARWIYTNYASLTEQLLPALAEIAPIVFDFSYKDEAYAEHLLPHVHVAAFSRDGYSGEQATELIEWARERGPEIVVVTRGAHGSVIGVDECVHVQSAVDTDVVDTLGAGDAFLARFLCGYLQNETLQKAAAHAAKAAAEVCRHPGAFGYGTPLDSTREGVR